METWFLKSLLAMFAIIPSFLAIPFFKFRFGIDPLVFLVWYFGGTSISIALYFVVTGKVDSLALPGATMLPIIVIGMLFGAVANGLLFQAIGLAPNPGLPPVIYATSSVIVFVLSAALASTLPALFKPVVADWSRVAGIVLVIVGLYLLAGGRLHSMFDRAA